MRNQVQKHLEAELELLRKVNQEYYNAMKEYKQLFEMYKDLYNEVKYKLDSSWASDKNNSIEF